jgi:glutaredoxin
MKPIFKIVFGVAIGFVAPRIPKWLTPSYISGNYSQYFPNKQTKVLVYGTQTCPYCAKTKEFLAQGSIPFLYIDLETNELGRKQFNELGGDGQVPKILIGDRQIIGFKPDAITSAWEVVKKNTQ